MTTEAQKRNIDNLKSRVGDLKRQLAEAEARLHAAQSEASEFAIGTAWRDEDGDEWKVIGHEGVWCGQAEPVLVRRNKSGKWGDRTYRGWRLMHSMARIERVDA